MLVKVGVKGVEFFWAKVEHILGDIVIARVDNNLVFTPQYSHGCLIKLNKKHVWRTRPDDLQARDKYPSENDNYCMDCLQEILVATSAERVKDLNTTCHDCL